MKTITFQQLERLDALYLNGQFNGAAVPNWSWVTTTDGSRMIAEAERVKPNTFRPAGDILKDDVRKRIRIGKLAMQENEFRFLMRSQAEAILWLQRSTNVGREAVVTRTQCRRIKVLMCKGFLRHRSNGEINSLSYKEAQKLIDEGNSNALIGH